MKYLKTIIFALLLLFSPYIFSQKNDTVKAKVTGTWILTKHTVPENGKEVNKLTTKTKSAYEFKDSGDFTWTFSSSYNGKSETVVTVGKWKISDDGKSIFLFNAKFLPPHDKDGTEGDHLLEIKKLTATELITPEFFYNETAGTSYYKKS